jgi:outer membrane protein OmpA-like peptidoglycan-associated protein
MKNIIVFFLIIISYLPINAQVDEPGYRFMKRLRGIQLPDSKVQEIMIDEASENIVISYRAKRIMYVTIVKLYSWDKIKEYRVDQNFELYNSFFAENGTEFYLNTDLYKQQFLKYNLKNDKIDTLTCENTPRGCIQVEPKRYQLRLNNSDNTWLFTVDNNHGNDVLVYFDVIQFNQIKKELETALQKDLYVREVRETMENEARDNQKTGQISSKAVKSSSKQVSKSESIELTISEVTSLIETGKINIGGANIELSKEAHKLLKNPTILAILGGEENTNIKKQKAYQVGEIISLKNILFEQGSSKIMTESYAELDRLVELLNSNPTMKIQVNGHTNNIGIKNMEISEQRAKAVVDYIVGEGIDPDRLNYKGYGDTKPIASNDTEEGRIINRRVEFQIISK